MNNEFTITYWIRIKDNPGWMKLDTDINFPPFTVNNGIQVFFSKIKVTLRVYILHPELGYRKLSADVSNYLQKDAFIALTNSTNETKLYINTQEVASVAHQNLIKTLEVSDYVMVRVQNGDLSTITIQSGLTVIIPAKVQKINGDRVTLQFLTGSTEIVELPKSRIHY